MPSHLNFSYIMRGDSTDRPPCVRESNSVPTLLAFTVGVSLPRAVFIKRPGGVFAIPFLP
jgi:hypothetical protein